MELLPAFKDKLWCEHKFSLHMGSQPRRSGTAGSSAECAELPETLQSAFPQRPRCLSVPTGKEGPNSFAFVTGAWYSQCFFIFSTLGL